MLAVKSKYTGNSALESAGVMVYVIEGGTHGREVWKIGRHSLERYWEGSRIGHGNYWTQMPVDMEELTTLLKKGELEIGLYDSIEKVSMPELSGS